MRASPHPALNRLTHVTETSRGYPTVERAYTYDSLGNMIQEEAEGCLEFHYHGYTLYENRECCTRAEYNGVKRWDYTYDGRGNLTSIDKYQRTTQGMQLVNSEKYVYDETGKLVQGTNEDGEVSLYTYNGLGVRVGRELIVQDNTHGYTDFHKETPSVDTGLSKPEVVKESYVVDYTRYTLDTLVKEESGGNTDRWLYGYQSLQVKITSEGTDWWGQQTSQNVLTAYTHHDRLGSIVNLTDQYGRNLVRADYREYGEIEFYETVTVNGGYRQIAPQLVYTNHDYDTVLELYYAKARFYDPADKRFLSMDPVKGSIADPQSLVPYVYCVDNPLRYVDPLGLVSVKTVNTYIADGGGKTIVKPGTGNSATIPNVVPAMPDIFPDVDPYVPTSTSQDIVTLPDTVEVKVSMPIYYGQRDIFESDGFSWKSLIPNPVDVLKRSESYSAKHTENKETENLPSTQISNEPSEDVGTRFVGFGIQIEASLSLPLQTSISAGLELVFYTDDNVRKNGTIPGHTNWYDPYIYAYGGGGGGASGPKQSVVDILFALQTNPSLLTNVAALSMHVPKGLSFSVSVFAIVGNSEFLAPESYRGDFDSASVTYHHVKGYVAISSKCVAVGVGLDTSYLSCGYSHTWYDLVGDGAFVESDFSGLATVGLSIAQTIET